MNISDADHTVPRLGLAFGGELRPTAWSGIPTGLASGLEENRAAAIHLAPRYGWLVHAALAAARIGTKSRTGGVHAPLVAKARSAELKRALCKHRTEGPITALIHLGSGFSLRARVPVATFEDMTVKQAVAMRPDVFRALPSKVIDTWITRQRLAYGRARVCYVASEWAAQSVVADYDVAPSKVKVVGFGANVVAQPSARSWDIPRLLFVGSDWRRKNGNALLEAFRRIREEFPGASLDVVGGHPALQPERGIRLHGRLDFSRDDDRLELNHLFETATCFAMPSLVEPFGIGYIEAGLAGVPSLGTRIGGAADAVGPGGILVDPTDMDAMIDGLRLLCDGAEARRLGELAFDHAREHTWARVAERILSGLGLKK